MVSPLRAVGRSASQNDWLTMLARVGYAAKGIVYGVVGLLSLRLALGSGGKTAGSREAIQEIGTQPFGRILLALTALGLTCYAVWRLLLGTLDTKDKGADVGGLTTRIGYASSGLINLGLALAAARMAAGSYSGGNEQAKQEWTAWLLSQPFGVWLVGALGVGVVSMGLRHFFRAYTASFMDTYAEMTAAQRTVARRIGRFGIAARALTFVLIGVFLLRAAWQIDPQETKGLSGALETLLAQPYGPWLLGIVAAGFLCYAVYCFSAARYRRF